MKRGILWQVSLAALAACVFAVSYQVGVLKQRKNETARIAEQIYTRALAQVRRPLAPVTNAGSGAAEPLVWIVEFIDFECPHSKEANTVLERILKDHPTEVRLIHRQFPLPKHRTAALAAEAAIEAERQGKLWEFRKRALSTTTPLSVSALREIAESVGLDRARFDAALEKRTHWNQVSEQVENARKDGVKTSPSFLVNGLLVEGRLPHEIFERLVDGEIRRAKQLLANGVSRSGLLSAVSKAD